MEKLSGALCIALSVLLFLSAAIWAVIIFNQVSEEVDFGTIVWNIVATVASIVLGVRVSLFAAKKVESSADKAGSSNNKLNTVGLVLAYSVIGIVFYGDQYFNMEEGIMLFPILIEAATLLVSIPATFILHRLNKINKKHWEQMIPCKKCLRTYDKKLADCPNCGQTNPSLNTDDAAQPVSSEPIKAAATKSAAAPTPPNPKKKISKGLLFGIIGIAVVAVVAIVVVIVLSLGGADDYGYDPPPSSSVDYSELLTQTYTNEEEGFAFKYPGGWDFENDDDSIVSINTAGLSFAANIGVAKGEADDEFFSATKGDFLDFYSEEFDELNIVSLSDVYLDGVPARKLAMTYTYEGVSFVGVQHFYKIGSDMYIVSYLSLQSNFDEYEPIFDAIMNSYRITCTENKTGSGPSNHDDAYNIAQAWLDAHPAFDMAISGGDNDLYQADGEEYYRFYLDYRHDILVHSKTGALFIRETDDGEYPSPPVITPLDDYYNRYYGANTPNGNKYPGEITYKGILVSSFLGVSKDSVIELLGTPSSENSTFYVFDYDGISFQCNTNWDITHVYPKPARCEVDGITLNKNRAGLIELLGNPDSEGPGEYDEDYGMTYYMPYYFIHITLPSPDEVATGIYMSQR